MTWGLVYWPTWLTLIGLTLLPMEIYALLTNPANTLSEYAWHELNVTHAFRFTANGVAWWVSFVMWILFVVVITLHIWFMAD